MKIFRGDGHLTEEAISALRGGPGCAPKRELDGGPGHAPERVPDPDWSAGRDAALAHISVCQDCAERFAGSFPETELLRLPPQFERGVERKLEEVRITVTPLDAVRKGENAGHGAFHREKPRDSRREYRRYSFKVAAAACLALLLLFSGGFTTGMEAVSRSRALNPDFRAVHQITRNLRDFSENLLHWEDEHND